MWFHIINIDTRIGYKNIDFRGSVSHPFLMCFSESVSHPFYINIYFTGRNKYLK